MRETASHFVDKKPTREENFIRHRSLYSPFLTCTCGTAIPMAGVEQMRDGKSRQFGAGRVTIVRQAGHIGRCDNERTRVDYFPPETPLMLAARKSTKAYSPGWREWTGVTLKTRSDQPLKMKYLRRA